ncbi:nitroreductase family protein [Clostridium beijerinckii]|uniref:Nitroreductase n=1 Tax=Clostridium beijerinckii TaxID=1520 RepID=A0A9Q5D390_CLOBE|nr:nitroreductase family protein [Clostridium beijerinckii]AQS07379.1 nitroreductase A [Clostridium beijerinckii]MBA2884559.1 nitroreductase [Clostridium beijerinckii]MBA2898071.1 nitroreductase [Clostridium beijerinckii]MBA2909922.1 nitroreductase [Clostridium beijerinckii]MBA9012988.1 nitroreductase [Clostridium beijerinckii]
MELMKAIAMRKSTRSYKSEQISDESLNTIINAGCAAPVGMGAYNSVHLTVIQNSDLLDKITAVTAKVFGNPNMKPFYSAPTLVIVSGKPNEKAPAIEVANAACIVENMSLAATDLGIGSVYLLGFLFALSSDNDLLKELNLPEGFVPAAALALGYPTEPLTKEKDLKQTIQINTIK